MNQRQLWLLKTLLHLSCVIPLLFLWLQIQSGAAGGDPVQYVIHFLGMGALQILVLTLMVSPLARWQRLPVLIKVRRLLGLWCFAYALLHLLAFLAFDLLFDWQLLLGEIVKRPYISIGMLAFTLLLLLALTSLKRIQAQLGRRWQQLHNGIYLIALLVPWHFWWSVKSGYLEPALYTVALLGLLAIRLAKKKIPQRAVISLKQMLSRLREKSFFGDKANN